MAMVPRADILEAGDHAQRRRFAAARRADQHDEFAILDVQIDVFTATTLAVGLVHVVEDDFGHASDLQPADDVFLSEQRDDQRRHERDAPRSRS